MLGFDFEIPCPHEEVVDKTLPLEERAEKHSRMPRLPDYHPLTKEEVAKFLDETFEVARTGQGGDIHKIYAIQIRLIQGIVGMTCPMPTCGEVHDKWQQVRSLHIEVIQNGSNSAVVEQMYKIMTG